MKVNSISEVKTEYRYILLMILLAGGSMAVRSQQTFHQEVSKADTSIFGIAAIPFANQLFVLAQTNAPSTSADTPIEGTLTYGSLIAQISSTGEVSSFAEFPTSFGSGVSGLPLFGRSPAQKILFDTSTENILLPYVIYMGLQTCDNNTVQTTENLGLALIKSSNNLDLVKDSIFVLPCTSVTILESFIMQDSSSVIITSEDSQITAFQFNSQGELIHVWEWGFEDSRVLDVIDASNSNFFWVLLENLVTSEMSFRRINLAGDTLEEFTVFPQPFPSFKRICRLHDQKISILFSSPNSYSSSIHTYDMSGERIQDWNYDVYFRAIATTENGNLIALIPPPLSQQDAEAFQIGIIDNEGEIIAVETLGMPGDRPNNIYVADNEMFYCVGTRYHFEEEFALARAFVIKDFLPTVSASSSEDIEEKYFSPFPNPSSEGFRLKLPNSYIGEEYNLTIYDQLGARITYFEAISEENFLFGQNLRVGTYYVCISSSDRKTVFYKRIIKL